MQLVIGFVEKYVMLKDIMMIQMNRGAVRDEKREVNIQTKSNVYHIG